jgi:hypothetical protein
MPPPSENSGMFINSNRTTSYKTLTALPEGAARKNARIFSTLADRGRVPLSDPGGH